MSLGEQIPYEEPSEEEWDEMARVVFDELEDARPTEGEAVTAATRRPLGWVAVAVAAVAAALLGYLALRPAPPVAAPAPQTTRLASTSSPSHVTLGEVRVELAAASSGVAVGGDAQGWVVTLEQGSASFAVPPRRGRPPFLVQAGDVRVEVVGTRFRVTRAPSAVRVAVERGVVRVTSRGESVALRAGETWTDAPEPEAAPPEPDAVPAQPAPPPEPERPSVTLDDAALFQRASALEARDPSRAARLYADITRRGGRWSGAALFARGRLELDRGNRDVAEALLRRYLRRHPDGLNARDAREMLERSGRE